MPTVTQPHKPTPPRPCPICLVAMQTTEERGRLVNECHNCGMTIVHVLPNEEDE